MALLFKYLWEYKENSTHPNPTMIYFTSFGIKIIPKKWIFEFSIEKSTVYFWLKEKN